MCGPMSTPATSACLAHARRGSASITIARLGHALPGLIGIGGSHAQRDLFEQIYLAALLRDGHWVIAQRLLEQRRAVDPDNVPVNLTLASVYEHLQLPLQAGEARARAQARVAACRRHA